MTDQHIEAQDAPAEPDLHDPERMREALYTYLVNLAGVAPGEATPRDWFYALAHLLRGELGRRLIAGVARDRDAKRMYFLSMEYLPGRNLIKNLHSLGLIDSARQALKSVGRDLDDIAGHEFDAALGNGGLGRLAACFLDSLATHHYPAVGYGLRYEFGMFTQRIVDGQQVEKPEGWLRYGNPWEFERPSTIHPVRFYGRLESAADGDGSPRWVDADLVIAMAYDVPFAGHRFGGAVNLRLWSAKATREFDLADFNDGNYVQAVRNKTDSENLSKVLYPNDNTAIGVELRLKQEYFFVSASMQDILASHLAAGATLDTLPDRVAIQLNDTHPALAVPELMRILLDEHGMQWKRAWSIATQVFSYTNHTLQPEALETWRIEMLERVLPRHLDILYRINHDFLDQAHARIDGDIAALRRLSLVDDEHRRIRMAHLAIVGSHKVNGVAELHSRLLRTSTFADFDRLYPGKFVNVTNGVDPRRWLLQANPALAALITGHIGDDWTIDLERVGALLPLAGDSAFRAEFRRIKRANKERLARFIAAQTDETVDPDSMFDVQVKRIHEYKRQLLNILHVITRYNRIRDNRETGAVPRTVLLAGKAAPGYAMAKLIIRLINDVARTVNRDPRVTGLKLVFVPNYCVSTAELIMPAADLSQQISTAGTEASGTGNMKLALNGALTIGTLDGANIEIRDRVGAENMFTFGLDADQAEELRVGGYDPNQWYRADADLKRALDMISNGAFSPDEPDRYRPLVDSLLHGGDHYLVLADYPSYVACQDSVDTAFGDPDDWAARAIRNSFQVGSFSSDRAIHTYARDIWGIKSQQP